MILASSGCTVLNQALGGGFPYGKIVNIVGKESSGKSLLVSETVYQEKVKHKKKLKWRYNDAENKYAFDSKEMYGFDILNDDEEASDTLEEFDDDLQSYLNELTETEKLIYVLDSLDSISTEAEVEYYEKKRKARQAGKKLETGDMGLSKPKGLSRFFRLQNKIISNKNCLLFIISQLRTRIALYGPKDERAGGRALDHQSSQIIWLKEVEKYEKMGRVVGVCIRATISKNDVGKPFRQCYFDLTFYKPYGIDNVSTNINFLYDLKTVEGKSKKKEKIEWDKKEYTREGLITFIEKNNLEEELDKRVIKKWNDIEDAISSKNRKAKGQWQA